jgi:hypothetical protein
VILRTGALMVRDRAAVADAEDLSVTFRVKLDEPAEIGMPPMIPSTRLNPAGRDPLTTDHV